MYYEFAKTFVIYSKLLMAQRLLYNYQSDSMGG